MLGVRASPMTPLFRKTFSSGLFSLILLWGAVGFGLFQVCHGLVYGSIRNWMIFPWWFNEPRYLTYVGQFRSYWIAIGIFGVVTLVLGTAAAVLTMGQIIERRSFQRWS